jgi:hypothetical protein
MKMEENCKDVKIKGLLCIQMIKLVSGSILHFMDIILSLIYFSPSYI